MMRFLWFLQQRGLQVLQNITSQNMIIGDTYLVTGIDWCPESCLAIGEADMINTFDQK